MFMKSNKKVTTPSLIRLLLELLLWKTVSVCAGLAMTKLGKPSSESYIWGLSPLDLLEPDGKSLIALGLPGMTLSGDAMKFMFREDAETIDLHSCPLIDFRISSGPTV